MRYPPAHKQQARARIVEASGKAFRRHGYGSVGIDGLAREACVTSGAFYGHFKSKDAAFAEIAVQGLKDLAAAIVELQAEHGDAWLEHFVDFYLGERRTCEMAESCGLQSLTPDVMRANTATREAYEGALQEVVEIVASGLRSVEPALRGRRALALLALLSGGVTIARGMASEEQSEEIAQALRVAAIDLTR